MIEISQLQTLVAVTKAKSFSKAADVLHVTQSAISQSIKNLEKKVDVVLFNRTGKNVIPTPEGEKLYSLASNFLLQMDNILDEIQHDKDSMSGKIRLGTLTGIGKSWLAPIMLQFAQENPELVVSINLAYQDELVKEFENYRLDFLILPEEVLPPQGEKILLGEERSVFVYPDSPEFPLHNKMNLEELSNYPTILFQDEGDGLYLNWCRERFGQFPERVNCRYIINSHGNMLQAVQKGLGVAVIPKHVLGRSYYKDKVLTLDADVVVSNGRFYLVYHKNSEDLFRIKATLDRLIVSKHPFKLR